MLRESLSKKSNCYLWRKVTSKDRDETFLNAILIFLGHQETNKRKTVDNFSKRKNFRSGKMSIETLIEVIRPADLEKIQFKHLK